MLVATFQSHNFFTFCVSFKIIETSFRCTTYRRELFRRVYKLQQKYMILCNFLVKANFTVSNFYIVVAAVNNLTTATP